MLKKIIIGIGIVILVGAGYLYFNLFHPYSLRGQTNKAFLNTLKGEIVYLHRDSGDLNIYKISATGDNKILLYKNTFPSSSNRNALKPRWSSNGSNISFATMPGEFWSRYSMNSDGSNVTLEENYDRNSEDKFTETFGREELSRAGDIVVDRGSVYIVDNNGNRILVYEHKNYNPKFNPGADDASWGPDKNYIIFMLNNHGSNEIMIASKDGTQLAKLADGRDPDWKYDGKIYSGNSLATIAPTPVPKVTSTTITSPLAVSVQSGSRIPYVVSGIAVLATDPAGSELAVSLDGGINFINVIVQPDGTWSTAGLSSWFEIGPGERRSIVVMRPRDRAILATSTLIVTPAP